MLKKFINKIGRKNEKEEISTDFFALSSKEKKRIVKKATYLANKDQMKLAKNYDRKFGKVPISKLCSSKN
jgi:hypothetical protein